MTIKPFGCGARAVADTKASLTARRHRQTCRDLFECFPWCFREAFDPKTKKPYTIKDDGFRTTHYNMVGQYGTHVDPPAHFAEDGVKMDKIPLKQMILPLIVLASIERLNPRERSSDDRRTDLLRAVATSASATSSLFSVIPL